MNKNKLFSVLVPLVSVLLAFLIGCVIMAVLKANPATALGPCGRGLSAPSGTWAPPWPGPRP